jgi:hypothetical protein
MNRRAPDKKNIDKLIDQLVQRSAPATEYHFHR